MIHMETTALSYIGATDRAAAEAYNNWVAAGRPEQLALFDRSVA